MSVYSNTYQNVKILWMLGSYLQSHASFDITYRFHDYLYLEQKPHSTSQKGYEANNSVCRNNSENGDF